MPALRNCCGFFESGKEYREKSFVRLCQRSLRLMVSGVEIKFRFLYIKVLE
jgi:hypothetical protein